MADLDRYAVLFVFISNALMIIAMLYAGYRLWLTAEQARQTMTEASADLIEAGRGLRGLGDGVDRLIERMGGAEKQAAAVAKVAAESLSGLDSQLMSSLKLMLSDLLKQGGLGDERLHEEVRQLHNSLSDVQPAGFSDWEKLHHQEIDQVMAQCNLLTTENDQLRERMKDLQQRLQAMPKTGRGDEGQDSADALRKTLEQQRQMSAKQRERAQEAEQRAADAEARIDQLAMDLQRLGNDAVRQHSEDVESLAQSRRDVEQANGERDRLRRELTRSQESMARMAIEKDFIEDKFLGLEEHAQAGATEPG
jgi:uncharacterized membrane protein